MSAAANDGRDTREVRLHRNPSSGIKTDTGSRLVRDDPRDTFAGLAPPTASPL